MACGVYGVTGGEEGAGAVGRGGGGVFFAGADGSAAMELSESKVSFLKLRGEREPAVIPDKQMEDFRFLVDFSEEAVEMVNEDIAVGDSIQVVKGALKGLEGELVQFRGETKVAVRIDLLGCALVDIPASFVERVNVG